MAEKQGGLSLRIGLTLSQLQSDFLTAEQTIRQGVANLNRQQNLVKIRMDTDIAGLDAVADKTKILEVRERGLTQLLEMQRDKLTLATAAYRDYAASKGASDVGAKKLETAMERERLAVARLEAELKNLSSQKISLDTTQLQSNIAKLNAQIQHVRIKAEIDTSQLSGAASAFDAQKIHIAAVTKELELQRQKLIQLREAMYQSAKANGAGNVQTLNIKSNVLQQIQEIQRLEQKLKELQNTNVNLQIRAENAQKLEQTINERIARINATIGLIRVKTEVDTSKISGATAEFDKAKRQVTALNQELTLQNRKLAEMQKLLSQSSGTKAINLAADIQKQIQEIDRLKAKIKELNSIQPPKSGLLSGYLGIKGDISGQLNNIAGAFSQLKGATASADSAIVSVLGVIDAIPSPVGKAVTALASLPIVFAGIENSVVDMMKATAAAGDSVYVMSRGFQMSVADTAKFTTMCKTAGVEVNDLSSTLKRVQQQIVRGGDEGKAAQELKRYGESAYDSSGKLKDLNEMTLTLSRALKAAQAEGRGMEFILATMRNASADAITAIEDAADVYEQASHIVKAGIANPQLAHEVQGNLNAMGQQSAQLGASFKAALLPVANEIVPRMTERMGNLTQIIRDNKDVILDLGRDFAQVWGAVEDTVEKVGEGLSELAKLRRQNTVVPKNDTKTVVDRYKDDWSVNSAADIVNREMENGGYSDEDLEKLHSRQDLYRKEVARHNAEMKELWAERRKIFADDFQDVIDNHIGDDSIKTATDLLNKLTDEEKEAIAEAETGFGSMLERCGALNMELQRTRKELGDAAKKANEFKTVSEAVALGAQALGESEEQRKAREKAQKYYDEAAAIRYKTNHSDYENQNYDNYRWLKKELENEELSEQEKIAIREQYAARHEQIEKEKEDRLNEIRQRITADEQTESEKRMAAIDAEKEKWIQAGMDAAEAEQLAQKQKADYIKGVEQELSAALDELHQSDLEKRLAQIEQEKQAWINKGASPQKAEQLAQEKNAQAYQQQEDKLNEIRDSVASLYRSDVENKLAAIDKEQQAWVEAGMSEVEAAELAAAKKEKVYEDEAQKSQELADKKAKAEEDYQKRVQAAQEEADRKNKAARDEALNILKSQTKEFEAYLNGGEKGLADYEYKKLLKSGVSPELLKAMTPEKYLGYKKAKENLPYNLMPNWEDPYSPKAVTKSLADTSAAADAVSNSFDNTADAATNAADALNNFADSASQAVNNGGGNTYRDKSNREPEPEYGRPVGAFKQPDGSTLIKDIDRDKDYGDAMNNAVYSKQNDNEKPAQTTSQDYGQPTEIDTSAFSEAISTASASLNDLQTAVAGVTKNLSGVDTSQFEETTNAFSSIATEINEVTVQLSNLSELLGNLSSQAENFQPTETRQPVEVNNTIQIDEAHAWDYNHIQELAEKVAEIIQPVIVNAIGGDSNSY